MFRATRVLIAGLTLCLLGNVASAGTDAGGVGVAETVTATATVKAVDKETRKVTLEDEDGQQTVVTAGPEVKNFHQIDVGDQVIAVYTQSLVLELEKAGGPPAEGAAVAVEAAPKGAKPGVAGAATVEISAEVVAIDKEKRTVTVKGPKGNEVTLKVDPAVKRFDDLAVGDDIVATYTEAVALEVRAP